MRYFWQMALRNLSRNRIRTAITMTAIIFGTSGLMLSGGFVQDIFVQLGEALIHSQTGHAQIGREAIFGAGSRSPEKHALDDPAAIKQLAASHPAVKETMTRITFSGLLNNGKTDYAIIVEGMEPGPEALLGTHMNILAGRALRADDTHGAMLGQGVAKALQLTPGDRATLLASTEDGAMNTLDVEVVGVFQTFSRDFDARAVRIELSAAQGLLNTSGAGTVVVLLKDSSQTDNYVADLRGRLMQDLVVKDWRALNDFYEKTVELYKQQFGFLQMMILIMVALSVVNTINMSLVERSWEFGTMQALGNRSRNIAKLIITELVMLGGVSATLGVVVGAVLALIISEVGIPMPPPPNSELGYDAFIRLDPLTILQAWGTGFLATVAAGLLPAWRVARVPIVDALRAKA